MSAQVRDARVDRGLHEEEDRRLLRRVVVQTVLLVLLILAVGFAIFGDGSAQAVELRTLTGIGPQDYRLLPVVLDDLDLEGRLATDGYSALARPRDATLVTLDPLPDSLSGPAGVRSINDDQQRLLEEWIRDGGTWLVALDAPRIARIEALGIPVGVRANDYLERDWSVVEQLLPSLPPRDAHPLAQQIEGEQILLGPPFPVGPWKDVVDHLPAFLAEDALEPSWQVFRNAGDWDVVLRQGKRPVVIERRLGQGRVIVCASPMLFTNWAIARCGTGEVIAALVWNATERGRRSIVWDGFAQGVQTDQGLWRWLFFNDLQIPLAAALLVMALVLWRGAVRLGEPQEPAASGRRNVEEYIVTLADLQRAENRHAAATQQILAAGKMLSHNGQLPAIPKDLGGTPLTDRSRLRAAAQAVDTALARQSTPSSPRNPSPSDP